MGLVAPWLGAYMDAPAALASRCGFGAPSWQVVRPTDPTSIWSLQGLADEVSGNIGTASTFGFGFPFAFSFPTALTFGRGCVLCCGRLGVFMLALVLVVRICFLVQALQAYALPGATSGSLHWVEPTL